MSQAYVNQLTIDCLLNKDVINKHLKSKQSKKENKEEIKFYKKRIYNNDNNAKRLNIAN